MRLYSAVLAFLLFSLPLFAEPNFAANDIYAFLGVEITATPEQVVDAFERANLKLLRLRGEGLAVDAHLRALTNVRNILLSEYSKNIYNAFLKSTPNAGTADQQQQFLADYFHRYRTSQSMEAHAETFPDFLRKHHPATYPHTDYSIRAVEEEEPAPSFAAVELPLVDPLSIAQTGTAAAAACSPSVYQWGRLLVLTALAATVAVIPGTHSVKEPPAAAPRPEVKRPAPMPPQIRMVPVSATKATSSAVTAPKAEVQAPAPTPEAAAQGRGQAFREKLGVGK